jgi:uncharacterized protein (TIGR01777 family)
MKVFGWDPLAGPPPAAAFEGVEAVFHMAGEPVAEGRWTTAKKQRLRDSRVIATRHLVQTLAEVGPPLKALVSASAVGYYGSRGDQILDESASATNDFLAQICVDWERAAAGAREFGLRVVNPRIGIVLGTGGGALEKMVPPFKMGVGGRLGDGRQWMPWIHIDDMIGLLLHAANNPQVEGPMNATAPNPVTNSDFTRELATALHRPALLPAPAFGLRLILGEFADVLLGSQRVIPAPWPTCSARRTQHLFWQQGDRNGKTTVSARACSAFASHARRSVRVFRRRQKSRSNHAAIFALSGVDPRADRHGCWHVD